MPEEGVNFKLLQVLDAMAAQQTTLDAISFNLLGLISNLETYMVASLSALEATAAATELTSDTLGIAAGGPTTTVAGLLAIIQSELRCAPLACSPGPDDAEGCQEPLVSFGQVSSPDYTGRVFATWLIPDLTPGLTEGSFLAHDVDNAQIVHEATSGWKVFVQSNGAGSCSINPDGDAVISTNRWVNIDLYQDMAFNVPAGADITVYLCDPTEGPFVDCVTIDSVAGTYTNEVPIGNLVESISLQALPFDAVPSGVCDTVSPYGTSFENQEAIADVPCSVCTSDAQGWTFRLISGATPVRVHWVSTLGARDSQALDAVDDTVTISINTSSVWVVNAGVTDPAGSPFTVEICPGV